LQTSSMARRPISTTHSNSTKCSTGHSAYTDQTFSIAGTHHLVRTADYLSTGKGRLAIDDEGKFPDFVLTNPLTTTSCVHNANFWKLTQDFRNQFSPNFPPCFFDHFIRIHRNFLSKMRAAPFPLRAGEPDLQTNSPYK